MTDKIDLEILKILKKNGRESATNIGKMVNLSEAAVRKRISSLVKDGIISSFTIKLGEKKPVKALIYVKLENTENHDKIISDLKKMSEVLTIFRTTSDVDFIVHAVFLNIDHFNNFVDNISAIEEVKDTKSKLILSEL